ncbi:MAG: hypothetical protein AAF502_23595 [Bacteroidota bacterium]
MKTLKALTASALALILCLLCLMTTTKNPIDVKYEKVIDSIMEKGDFNSESEILAIYSEVESIKSKMEKLKKLECKISHNTGNPVEMRSNEERLKLCKQLTLVSELRKEILLNLNSIEVNHFIASKD